MCLDEFKPASQFKKMCSENELKRCSKISLKSELIYMYIEFESEALSIANSEYFAKARIAIHNSN